MNANLGKTEFTDAEMADLRDRLRSLRETQSLTWKQLGTIVGVPEGTISAWVPNKYAGDNAAIAAKVYRYFQAESERQELAAERPAVPDFIMTDTAKRVWASLAMAQQSDMTAFAGNPGQGKTATIVQYKATRPNVWVIAIRPSNGGVAPMLVSLLRAMGVPNPRGVPGVLADMVIAKITGTKGLIVVDDAQNATIKAIEELRGIHDATGIGVAMVGHLELISNLRPHAQLFSRLGSRHTQRKPLQADIVQLAAAWGVERGPELTFLLSLGRGQGGLRTLTKTCRNATFLARREGVPLHIDHLKSAASQGETEIEG